MKVILQEDVLGLGEEGDVCEVAAGYARNFLLRQKAAVRYSTHAVAQLEHHRDAIEKRRADKRASAVSLRDRLEAETLTFEMTAGDTGKLFGSITNAAIAAELESRGYEIERRRIEVPDHSLKTIGEHEVRLRLYESESANLKVIITGEGGSAAAAAAASDETDGGESEPAPEGAADAAGSADAGASAESQASAEAASDEAAEPVAD